MKSSHPPSPLSVVAFHESEKILRRTSQLRQASDELGSSLSADPQKEAQDEHDHAYPKHDRTSPGGELVRAQCPVVQDARACAGLEH